jgi:hypothetical protein
MRKIFNSILFSLAFLFVFAHNSWGADKITLTPLSNDIGINNGVSNKGFIIAPAPGATFSYTVDGTAITPTCYSLTSSELVIYKQGNSGVQFLASLSGTGTPTSSTPFSVTRLSSGTGLIGLNQEDGSISVGISQPGSYSITYSYFEAGGATATISYRIVIEDIKITNVVTYDPATPDCNQYGTLTATITYFGDPTAITISSTLGNISVERNISVENGGIYGGTMTVTVSNLSSTITDATFTNTLTAYVNAIGDDPSCSTVTTTTLYQPANISLTSLQESYYNGSNIRCKDGNDGWTEITLTGGKWHIFKCHCEWYFSFCCNSFKFRHNRNRYRYRCFWRYSYNYHS